MATELKDEDSNEIPLTESFFTREQVTLDADGAHPEVRQPRRGDTKGKYFVPAAWGKAEIGY